MDLQFAIYRDHLRAPGSTIRRRPRLGSRARVNWRLSREMRLVLIGGAARCGAAVCAGAPGRAGAAYDREAVEACAGDPAWPRVARPTLLVDIEVRRYGLEARVAELRTGWRFWS